MRELSLQIADEFRHVESESEAVTLNFLKGEKQEMVTKNEKVYARFEMDIEVTNLTKDQFQKKFFDFLEQLKSQNEEMDFKALDGHLIEMQTVAENGQEEFYHFDREELAV